MRWATRAGAHIDRAACAWLIRRHLYPEPEFVHEADIDDERFDASEARGLDVSLRGLSMICADERVLEITGPIFDGLYEFHRRALLMGREPA